MAIRRASAYSRHKVVPFTRVSKRKNKSYIRAVPPRLIVKFTMGLTDLSKFPHHITLVSTERIQLRQNAIEACRQFINKGLTKGLAGQFYFKILPYPHHIQRENRMITGAGADRMQTGMQLSFGKTSAIAALVKKDGELFFIAVANEKAVVLVRKLLQQIKSKLPCRTRVIYELKN